MNKPAPSDLTLREPTRDEAFRIAHIFRHTPLAPGAQILAATRRHPIERFVAAVACWPQGNVVCFRLACQPGVPRAAVAGPLLKSVEESARKGGVHTLHYAEALADDSEWSGVLGELGFERTHSQRFFEVPAPETYARITQTFENHKAAIPTGWRTEAIRRHPPEVALGLIEEHRLMPTEELMACWRENSTAPFERNLSCILFDGANAIGALLARRTQDVLCVDVRVVRAASARLRALGNACLLHHAASESGPGGGSIRWVLFRAGENEHRETANLAFRMKGRELPRRHLFAKKL